MDILELERLPLQLKPQLILSSEGSIRSTFLLIFTTLEIEICLEISLTKSLNSVIQIIEIV
jgi:hypothetical protein